MPAVRRSQRGQRLSDYFPAIDALSPIVSKSHDSASPECSQRKSASTPARKGKGKARKKRPLATVQSTPVFDPNQSFSEDEFDDSEEDEFIRSLRFSPCKATSRHQADQKTPATSDRVADHQVVVDYNSDSDGFAFSPVKFTPGANKSHFSKPKIKGTPMPAAKIQGGSRMVWNSTTKKVEECPSNLDSYSPEKSTFAMHDEQTANNQRLVPIQKSVLLDADTKSGEIVQADCRQSGYATESHSSRIPSVSCLPEDRHELPIKSRASSPSQRSCVCAGDLTNGHSPDLSLKARIPPSRQARRVKASHEIIHARTGSPPVRLTRAVSGSLPMQRLEKLTIPQDVLEDCPENAKSKRQRQAFARVPRKIPSTVPVPFELSQARSKAAEISSEIRNPSEKENIASQQNVNAAGSDILPVARQSKNKRKASEMGQEPTGLQSPAKRIRAIKTMLPPSKRIHAHNNIIKPRPTVPSFEFSSDAILRQRAIAREEKLRREAEEEAGKRRPVDAGLVPRTLYSPEKMRTHIKTATPTKPQPFRFSTEARASRSPLVSTPVVPKPMPRKMDQMKIRVPALEVAPFVPKPSMLPTTIAASPIRKLPSRLETRREFDRMAEMHADQVVQRKRREEELLAAERERKMEERRGWKDMGTAAIEQWAARARMTSNGKRDWID